jgi:site-specific DNA recombinase
MIRVSIKPGAVQLQSEYTRLQNRIDAMYDDKLDGRIDSDFFDRRASECRHAQDQILVDIEEHHSANVNYLDEGVALLELAARAGQLFECQSPSDQRLLLNHVVSNCSWKDGNLTADYRQPFDIVYAASVTANVRADDSGTRRAESENWRPRWDSNPRSPP